jgi:hypothetical protein
MQQLSLSARPQTLDALVGQQKVVESIRGQWATGRIPKAWMFSGKRGTGKTSTAKILALSYQCTHQTMFGRPCKECRKNRSSFPIYPIPAAKLSGKEEIKSMLEGSDYGVIGEGQYRVYILDECHRMTSQAQSLLLDYLEESPDTTVFILCTNQPQDVLDTIHRRCVQHVLRELELDDIVILVNKLLKFAKSDLPEDRLVEALVERGVKAPGLIAQAVEKYVAGESPDEASNVEGITVIDVKTLNKAVMRGDWPVVSQALLAAEAVDIKGARLALISYLKKVLLDSPDFNDRNTQVSKAISALCEVQNAGELVMSAAMTAELYRLCSVFSKYGM